jgi:hypothetical protein
LFFERNNYLKSLYTMFTELYLNTTNPKIKLRQFLLPYILFPMVISIIMHTVVYALFCNMVSYILFNKFLSLQINQRLLGCLLLIMIFGFIGRYFHVKDVYNAYNRDEVKTRNHLDRLYISWLFIS